MPRLLRGVARTAVIAGTASAVNGRVQRRQAQQFAERDAGTAQQAQPAAQQAQPAAQPAQPAVQPAPVAPAAASEDSVIDQLRQLGELHTGGVLTDEEFAAAKAKLLGT